MAAHRAAADGVAADSSSATEGQQAAEATAVATPALSTDITGAATGHESHAQAGEEGVSSSEPAALASVEADSAAHRSGRVGEPSQAPQPDDAAAVSASAVAVAEETEAAAASAADADAGETEAAAVSAAVADGAATSTASVHDSGQQVARGWPQLSCKQAFAAIQYATGDMMSEWAAAQMIELL